MAIQSGIGVGEAQIYDTSGSLNTYARLMQKQQAQRQAEQKALQDQLAKVKTDGLRDADKPLFLEKYEKAKELFRKSLTAKGREKMELQAQMDNELMGADDIGNRSREYKKLHSEISNKFLDDKFRDQFTDEAVQQWQDTDKYTVDDEKLIKDPSKLARQVNTAEIDDRLTKIDKALKESSQWSNPITEKGTEGNRTGVFSYNKREVAPEKQYQAYLNEYDSNRNLRKHLADQYGDLPKEAVVKAYADERRATGLLTEKSKPDFKENDNSFEKHVRQRQYDIAHPTRDGSSKDDDKELYTQKLLTGILNGEKGYKEILSPYLPVGATMTNMVSKPTANSKGGYKLLRVHIPAVVTMTNGKPTIVKPEVNKDIPISKGDAFNELNAIIGQYGTGLKTNMPKLNTVEGKGKGDEYKADVDKSRKPAGEKPKVIKKADIASKAKAAGYTEKEYIKLLKEKGVTIQ